MRDLMMLPNTMIGRCFHARVPDRTAGPPAPPRSRHSAHSDLGELTCAKCKTFYNAYVSVVDRNRLQEMTTKQSACRVWRDARKLRITASTAKKVPKKETTDPVKFLRRHLHPSFGRNAYSGHGIDTEPEALAELQTVLGKEIQPSGTVCHAEEPWLSASPDGVFLNEAGEKTVVEVKCPVLDTSLEDAFSQNRSVADLEYHKDADPKFSLMKFGYYTQVQLTMYCTDARKCKYFVYNTPGDYVLIDVDYDEDFVQNLVEWLKKFYFKIMLPRIVDEVSYGRLELCRQYKSLCSK